MTIYGDAVQSLFIRPAKKLQEQEKYAETALTHIYNWPNSNVVYGNASKTNEIMLG